MSQPPPADEGTDSVVSGPPTSSEDAVSWIVNEHGGAMLAYATRLSNDRGEAEDVVQEALIRAWRAWSGLDPHNGSLRGWLLTVVRNLVIDKSRARSSRPPEAQFPDWDFIEEVPVGQDAVEVRDELFHLMAGLTHDERAVLVEIYLRDKSVSQAAETLGIPPGTVKSRSYYALRKLRVLASKYA